MLDARDFGDVSGLEQAANGQGVTIESLLEPAMACIHAASAEKEKNLPLRAAEAEAVGKIAAQRLPELLLLVLGHLQQVVVVLLELLVLLDNLRVSNTAIGIVGALAVATVAAATVTALPALLHTKGPVLAIDHLSRQAQKHLHLFFCLLHGPL